MYRKCWRYFNPFSASVTKFLVSAVPGGVKLTPLLFLQRFDIKYNTLYIFGKLLGFTLRVGKKLHTCKNLAILLRISRLVQKCAKFVFVRIWHFIHFWKALYTAIQNMYKYSQNIFRPEILSRKNKKSISALQLYAAKVLQNFARFRDKFFKKGFLCH